MKNRLISKISNNAVKHMTIFLCILLSIGCAEDDSSTSDKSRPTGRDHDTTMREKFNQGVYHSRSDEHVYRYKQHPTSYNQVPDCPTDSNTTDWQGSHDNCNWSDVDKKPLSHTTTNTQSINEEPHNIPSDGFSGGCSICCEENAYKTYRAVQCHHCESFVCQQCYEQLDDYSGPTTTSDYRTPAGTSTGGSRLKKRCPFCRKGF